MTRQEYVDEFIFSELSTHFEIADDIYEVITDLEEAHIIGFKDRYEREISEFFTQAGQQMLLRLAELKEKGSVEIDRSWYPVIIASIGYKQRAYLNLLLTEFCESDELEAFKTRFGQEIIAVFEEHESLVTLNLTPLLKSYVEDLINQDKHTVAQ